MVPKVSSGDLEVQEFARKIRILSLLMIYFAQSGHPGGCLSVADAVAFLAKEKVSLLASSRGARDSSSLVLSKGHSVPVLYAAGYLEGLVSWAELLTFRSIDSRLQGHPDVLSVPWLETSTGSLGQGFSFAAGLALGRKLSGDRGDVVAVLGDGELQEGQVWEAAMFSAHHKLGNLSVIIDRNGLQSDSPTEVVSGLEPLADKWAAFGWEVVAIDGHEISAIRNAMARSQPNVEIPRVIIANTVKGKGVGYMEGMPAWHGSVAMTDSQLLESLADLGVPGNVADVLMSQKEAAL